MNFVFLFGILSAAVAISTGIVFCQQTILNIFWVLLKKNVSIFLSPACDCNYHSGGCVISRGAASGNVCKCVYKGAWTCSGFEVGCPSGHHCAGGCTSRQCCNDGGGDCGGY